MTDREDEFLADSGMSKEAQDGMGYLVLGLWIAAFVVLGILLLRA